MSASPPPVSTQQESAARWARMEELFHRALECPPAERPYLIEEWCGEDAAMARDVGALLSSNEEVEERISSQLEEAVKDGFLYREGAGDGPDAWIGRVLGSFRLERLLGRGGMGVVYLAHRVRGSGKTIAGLENGANASGEAEAQAAVDAGSPPVAVKLLGHHLRSSPAVAQFLMERNVLAQLEHRNIARLLDGGVASEGIPYLVMEFIDGRRLDDYCDDAAVTHQQVVQLVIQLADAITYVHRNLILHRDLKPGNVMVTADGVVKLLDFGTLKHIGPGAQANSEMTQAGMRPVTLRYASPEHIQGESVSTASDTYSLGMILYRLVAGRLPDVPSDLPIGQYLDALKAKRFTAPSTIARKPASPQLARDLDAVILKATAWNAADRYASAADLASDLHCLLEDRPVSARNMTVRYRALKFYRRHTRKAVAAVAVLLVLALGIAGMARESQLASAEQHRAEAGVEQERHLAHLLLFDYFDQLKQIPGSTEAQRKAVTQALGYLDSLSRTAVGPAIELDNIKAYTSMGALLDDPYEENIGDEKGAIATLEKAIALAHQLVARDPRNLEFLQASAAAETELGAVYFGAGDAPRAFVYLKSAADTSRTVARSPKATPAMLAKAATVVDGLGDVYYHEGTVSLNDPDKAMQTLSEVQDIYHQCLRMDANALPCRRGLVISFYKLALLNATDEPERAGDYIKEGLAALQQLPKEMLATPRMMRLEKTLKEVLAASYLHTGRMREGVALFQAAKAQADHALAIDPVDARARFDLVSVDSSLAEGYELLQQPEQEEESLRGYRDNAEALAKLDPANDTWQFRLADALLWSARAAAQRGDSASADRYDDEGLSRAITLAQKPDAGGDVLELATDYLLHSDFNAGRDHKRDAAQALIFAKRCMEASAIPSASKWLDLAEAQRAAGLIAESKASARSGMALLAKHPKSVHNAEEMARGRKLLQS